VDVSNNRHPTRHADPNESGCGVHFTFADNERAQFNRDLNRGSAGEANDLTTNAGTPIIGQGGGIYVPDDAASYRQGAVYAAGVAMAGEHEVTAAPAADRIVVQNGAQHLARVKSTGRFEASLNSGATYSTADWDFTGRGPFHWAVAHDGANQRLYINRTLADSDAVALGVPAGNIQIGRSGTTRRARFHNIQPDAAAVQAMYLRDFASRIVYQWTPRDVGEGPASGVLTGSTPGGYATCPSGGATLQFVWRNDLSASGGGRLTLTDSNVAGNRRIELMHTKMPLFGSILIEYTIRDPVTDSPIIGFTPVAGQDPVVAGSGSYWLNMYNTLGGWWRTSLYLANGAQIDAADCAVAPIVAGTRMKALWTRAVDGTNQAYVYNDAVKSWFWSAIMPVDVGVLSSNYITVCPRGSYIERITRFQGEFSPHEGGLLVP
jgi:hypothetical protein